MVRRARAPTGSINLGSVLIDSEKASGSSKDFDIIEKFASEKIELLPSPIEVVDPGGGGGKEMSVVNLASTVMMLESEGKRMLLTAMRGLT